MEIRFVEEKDLDQFGEWWELRDSTFVLDYLPPLGICAEDAEGNLLAAAWVYEMECISGKVGYIGWMTTNPHMPKSSYEGMQEVVASIQEMREDRNWIMTFATTNSAMLNEILIDQEFAIGDTGVTQYVSFNGN